MDLLRSSPGATTKVLGEVILLRLFSVLLLGCDAVHKGAIVIGSSALRAISHVLQDSSRL